MKLHEILPGWTEILTRSCVSPQVFHGSMRLMGCGRVVAIVRGVKPSRQCSKPWQPQAGVALESGNTVKLNKCS